jgi:hypothetical protein
MLFSWLSMTNLKGSGKIDVFNALLKFENNVLIIVPVVFHDFSVEIVKIIE